MVCILNTLQFSLIGITSIAEICVFHSASERRMVNSLASHSYIFIIYLKHVQLKLHILRYVSIQGMF